MFGFAPSATAPSLTLVFDQDEKALHHPLSNFASETEKLKSYHELLRLRHALPPGRAVLSLSG